ncbi:MAG: hypothetical protein D6785_03445 [Planctomycetota bacterium]|nr:MAG: hypothetical protein D6785_03445 [Planctomycetota bacterium]
MSENPNFKMNDIVIKIFHPPIQLTKKLYVDLIDRLSDYYNNQSVYPDKFSFSASRQKVATITSNMCSVAEIFDDDEEAVKNKVFKTINNIVVGAQLSTIDYFDLVTSVIYTPKSSNGNPFSFEKVDNIGNSFLKKLDYQNLGAQNLTTGIHWFFSRGKKNYTLKLEPYRNSPGSVFIDLIVLFPQESVSIAEIKMLVREEMEFLKNQIYSFVSSQMENLE